MDVLVAKKDFLVSATGERVGAGEYVADDLGNAAICRAKAGGFLVVSPTHVPTQLVRRLKRSGEDARYVPAWSRLRGRGVSLRA